MLRQSLLLLFALSGGVAAVAAAPVDALALDPAGYFETRGVNVLVYNNAYDGAFSDAKISSIELIHHGVRTATNGDVRLSATPGQWDPVPKLTGRHVDLATGVVRVDLVYPEFHFKFALEVQSIGAGVAIRVLLDQPLPAALRGRAGLNLEFLPSAYFHHGFLADGAPGIFPLHPSSDMQPAPASTTPADAWAARDGRSALAAAMAGHASDGAGGPHWQWQLDPPPPEPQPIATAKTLTLAPEDPLRRVRIETTGEATLSLYDGRNQATNGWFVVRTLLPEEKTGVVVEWHVTPNAVANWTRRPVIGHSQLGYTPAQTKLAMLELDANAALQPHARVLRIEPDGTEREVFSGAPKSRGRYLRYNYAAFDFSGVREAGLYELEYGSVRTKPFRIAADVYDRAWHPTLDVYLPVAMDHMLVKEAYRVWHGDAHRDDALQAPPHYEHFDLYAMGPSTDTQYRPGEHIPGLNIGGWFDAGDYDIRTQTQYDVVETLVRSWEDFHLQRDETLIDEDARHVELHNPDGVPDIIQQIEHGALQLVAQFHATGHAIDGIIDPVLSEYTHLGDAASKTDNFIYDPKLPRGQIADGRSGTFDDRWAFTTETTPLNYGSAAALAAASRALTGYKADLAAECLMIARRTWDAEQRRAPKTFHWGNTTGGPLELEEFAATAELLVATKEAKYANRLKELWPTVAAHKFFAVAVPNAVRVLPYLDEAYRTALRERVAKLLPQLRQFAGDNPYGVPITRGGWAGNRMVMAFGIDTYLLHRAFPDLVPLDGLFRSFDYLMGCHPDSDISFVSDVGTVSKEVAYGNNRADFTFIAGGIVPGILVLNPDFPENKEDWPFFWGENEYVVNEAPLYIYLANAVRDEAAR